MSRVRIRFSNNFGTQADLRRGRRSRNKTNVVYCRTGGQASHAYFTLRYLGYSVKMYDGSFFQWNKQDDTTVAR
ncbi:MAG: hypothetical protein IPK58_06970 [Acidobacteria bacterium]|nr:hypothetical protein [Acidobacteriota bacterium]